MAMHHSGIPFLLCLGVSTAALAQGTQPVTGSGTPGQIPVWTGTQSIGDSVITQSGGNVGIGTTTPASSLDVRSGSIIASLYGTTGGNHWVEVGNTVTHMNFGVGVTGSTAGVPYIWSYGNNLFIGNDGSPTVFVQGMVSGNVGIGTATPAAKVDIAGGNLNLENSSSTTGNILKGGVLFLHNFGSENTFLGSNAGNLTMYGPAAIQNTAVGGRALQNNTTGAYNTALGRVVLIANLSGSLNTAVGGNALYQNTTGGTNTGIGYATLANNTTGYDNIAIGAYADSSVGNLYNATVIGAHAQVNASNKIRLGNTNVTVIEGAVPYTYPSDRNQKENFQRVDGEEVLGKIRGLNLTSWNYVGHDPKQFRHYGPMAQDFFAAFGDDQVGTIGTPTTINSGDMAGVTLAAVQALEKRTEALRAENAELKARLKALEQKVGANALASGMPKTRRSARP